MKCSICKEELKRGGNPYNLMFNRYAGFYVCKNGHKIGFMQQVARELFSVQPLEGPIGLIYYQNAITNKK